MSKKLSSKVAQLQSLWGSPKIVPKQQMCPRRAFLLAHESRKTRASYSHKGPAPRQERGKFAGMTKGPSRGAPVHAYPTGARGLGRTPGRGAGALYAAELSVTHWAFSLSAKTIPGRASSPRPPPGEKVVIGRETPDSSAWAFMARDWILTFRCAPARRLARPGRGRRRGAHIPPARLPAARALPARRGKGRDLPTESISRSRWRSRMLCI